MNDISALISAIGELTKMWTVIYSSFVDQGLSKRDAMEHTKELMGAMIGSMMKG